MSFIFFEIIFLIFKIKRKSIENIYFKVEYNRFDDDEFSESSDSVGFSPTDTRQPFTSWLANNINKVSIFTIMRIGRQ